MIRTGACIFLIFFFSLITYVDASRETAIDKQTNLSAFESLRCFVDNSRQVLEAQVVLNWNYGQQVKLLADKLAEIGARLEDVQQSSTFCSETNTFQAASLQDMDNQTRIDFLGARALLGYKAQQLQTELHRLTQSQGNKLEAFENAMARAEDLSEQVMNLRFSIQKRLYQPGMQYPVFMTSEEKPNAHAQNVSGPANLQSQDSSDEQRFGPVLLTASVVATNGKPGPAKASAGESEAKYTTNDLKKKIDEIATQAKTLQQLIYETAQRAETIKKLEKQTEAKLNDMKQLTRNWEGKKIPVNEEFIALEKKLTGDVIMYQEALKEIEVLRQVLVSMFNGILFKESETGK